MVWTPGQVLQGGKYTIEKKLGQGGFGITYLARDKKGNPVVISGSEAIYNLSNWLNALGLKLTVTVCEEAKDKITNSTSGSELTV